MLLGKVKLGLAAMSALALIGCAHPDLIDPGASEVTVVNELGAPDSRMEFKDGSSILVYSIFWFTPCSLSEKKFIGCVLIRMENTSAKSAR